MAMDEQCGECYGPPYECDCECEPCDLATLEADGTWLRATHGYGVEIIPPTGLDEFRGPGNLYDYACWRAKSCSNVWVVDFWTDARDALEAWLGLRTPRWHLFLARVEDVANDLSIILSRGVVMDPHDWLMARATLLYLRAEASYMNPSDFPTGTKEVCDADGE